ncbi:MAG: hypothetical protein II886_13190, partial [Prevotella sp.]|nr:hypothetical protein [Prevotella sp.]
PTVNGYSLLWNNDTKHWYYGAAAGGVTSVAMSVPTGFSVSGSPITASGTLALTFASGYSLPTTAKQTQWDTAYGWGDHSQAGYLTGITQSMVTSALGYTPLSNATTFWGQAASNGAVNGIMTFSTLAMATSYTDTWSDGTNTHPWHGYDHRKPNTGVFSTTISDYFGLTLKTGSGNISMNQAGNVGIGTSNPSYKLDVYGTMRIIGVESNDITVIRNTNGAITTNALYGLSAIRHALSFKWYSSEWQIGNLRSADTSSDGFAVTEGNNKLAFRVYNESSYGYIAHAFGGIRVGDGMIVWDSVNNALKVIKPDGTAANFYATGAVSALGMSAGTSSVDTMAFNYLTVNTRLHVKGSGFTHSFYGDSNGSLVISGSEGVIIDNNLIVDGYDINTGGGSIYTGGGRVFLDSSRYIYVSGGNLYYYNGSVRKQIAFTS